MVAPSGEWMCSGARNSADIDVSVIFGVNFPLNQFLQNLAWGGLPGSHPHAKFYHFGLVNVGLRPKKSPKMLICGIHFPKGVYLLRQFLQNFAWGKGASASGPHPHAKFHRCSFKTVAVRHQKSPKMVIFGKNLPLGDKFWGAVDV